MRYIYVDLGAYDGQSVNDFMHNKRLPTNASNFIVYAFEPNPDLHLQLFNNKYISYLSDEAAWIEDGELNFAVDKSKSPMGSTLMESKKQIWQKYPKIKVKVFDFPKWIEQFEDDYLIVRMDIEGAEFPILYELIETGRDKIIDQLWLETHENKVQDYTTADAKELKQDLNCYVEELR